MGILGDLVKSALRSNKLRNAEGKRSCKTCANLKVEGKPFCEGAQSVCSMRAEIVMHRWAEGKFCDDYDEKPKEDQVAEQLVGVWDIPPMQMADSRIVTSKIAYHAVTAARLANTTTVDSCITTARMCGTAVTCVKMK